jgi:myo-inositol-1(or 4)-monophosphatase
MSQSLHPMLNIAIKAARAAGAVINRGSMDLDLLTVESKGPNDFVSEVDRMAEQVVIETLLQAYPGHGILAEESGREHGARDSDYVWIIDPLDGTTNFLHGLPIYAVSIALSYRGQIQQAVVYDPARNDLFYASRGRGAYLNDRRIRVSRRVRMADSLIGTGFPFRKGDNLQRYLRMFETVMTAAAGLRRTGSAALDLCYVAAGWFDGFFETGLNPWDVAAGSLIITEAGGLCGNFTGEADFLNQRELVCGTPRIYAQMVKMLTPFSRVIKADEASDAAAGAPGAGVTPTEALAASMARGIGGEGADEGTTATTATDAAAPAPAKRKPLRIRKTAEEAPAEVAPIARADVDAAQADDATDTATPSDEAVTPTDDAPTADSPAAPRVIRRIPREAAPDSPPAREQTRAPRDRAPADGRGRDDNRGSWGGDRDNRNGPRGPADRGQGPRTGAPRGDNAWGAPRGDGPRGQGPRGDNAWGAPRGDAPRGNNAWGGAPRGDGPRGPRADDDRRGPPRDGQPGARGPRPAGGGQGPRGPGRGPAPAAKTGRGKPRG